MKKLTLMLCVSMLVAGSAIAMENSDVPAEQSALCEIAKTVKDSADIIFMDSGACHLTPCILFIDEIDIGLDDYYYTPEYIAEAIEEKRLHVQLMMAQSWGAFPINECLKNFRYKSLVQRLQISSGPRIEDVD